MQTSEKAHFDGLYQRHLRAFTLRGISDSAIELNARHCLHGTAGAICLYLVQGTQQVNSAIYISARFQVISHLSRSQFQSACSGLGDHQSNRRGHMRSGHAGAAADTKTVIQIE